MPSAIKLNHELADKGLVSILVEVQGSDEANLRAFMAQRFPDCDAFVCTSAFVPIPASNGIPNGAVIGVDGKLLWSGNPASSAGKIEELVQAELVKVKKGWGDTAEARKFRATLYGKGDFAGAATLLAALPEGAERTTLQAELDKRYGLAKKQVEALRERGAVVEAQAAAKDLLKAVGSSQWTAEVQPIVAEFDSEPVKAEISLQRKLDKIVKQVREKKADAAPKALRALLKGGAEGKVARRAELLLQALETTPK